MRVVFDTNVLVRGAMSPGGPAGAALQAVLEQREHEFITSTWLLQEVEDVLRDPGSGSTISLMIGASARSFSTSIVSRLAS